MFNFYRLRGKNQGILTLYLQNYILLPTNNLNLPALASQHKYYHVFLQQTLSSEIEYKIHLKPEKMLYYKEESYNIIGAAMRVYNTLGHGFLEDVYQEALAIELSISNIPFDTQRELRIHYGDTVLKHTYKPDFVCYDKIIVEIKAVSALNDSHRSQLYNYLHATGYKLGLLINFGAYDGVEHERKIL